MPRRHEKIRDLLYGLSDDDLEALLEYKRQMWQRREEDECDPPEHWIDKGKFVYECFNDCFLGNNYSNMYIDFEYRNYRMGNLFLFNPPILNEEQYEELLAREANRE